MISPGPTITLSSRKAPLMRQFSRARDDPGEWMLDKLRGAAVGEAAIAATDEESALLKSAAARERPNGQDTQSMPSASQLEGSQKVIASALSSHILCNVKHAAP